MKRTSTLHRAAAVVGGLAVAAGLSACGPDGGSSSSGSTSAPQPTASASDTEAAPQSSDAASSSAAQSSASASKSGSSASASSGATGAGSTPEATVEAYFHALGKKDPDAVCALTADGSQPTSASAQSMEMCKQLFSMFVSEMPSDIQSLLSQAKVTGKATISGDTATLPASAISPPELASAGTSKSDDGFSLKKIGDKWYIAVPK